MELLCVPHQAEIQWIQNVVNKPEMSPLIILTGLLQGLETI